MARYPDMILALVLAAGTAAGSPARDVTFFLSSDAHLGFRNDKASPPIPAEAAVEHNRATLQAMRDAVGQPFSETGALKGLGLGPVPKPRALILAGDLTDGGRPEEWKSFLDLLPVVEDGPGGFPVFAGLGNHDGGATSAASQGAKARHAAHRQARLIDAVSANGLHTAWQWDGVHVLLLNRYAADAIDPASAFKFGTPGPGSWHDPEGALEFLKGYLQKAVGTSGAPVILCQHLGFDEGFTIDWRWWSSGDRRRLYDAIQEYNVVAIFHGHTHAPAHHRWPDPKAGAAEVERLFGKEPPRDLRSFDVFCAGASQRERGPGEFYVFRVVGERFAAAHRGAAGWSPDPALHVVKALGGKR